MLFARWLGTIEPHRRTPTIADLGGDGKRRHHRRKSRGENKKKKAAFGWTFSSLGHRYPSRDHPYRALHKKKLHYWVKYRNPHVTYGVDRSVRAARPVSISNVEDIGLLNISNGAITVSRYMKS